MRLLCACFHLFQDLGLDIPTTGREDAPTFLDEIHMRYFPERQMHKPYGDPHANRNECKDPALNLFIIVLCSGLEILMRTYGVGS